MKEKEVLQLDENAFQIPTRFKPATLSVRYVDYDGYNGLAKGLEDGVRRAMNSEDFTVHIEDSETLLKKVAMRIANSPNILNYKSVEYNPDNHWVLNIRDFKLKKSVKKTLRVGQKHLILYVDKNNIVSLRNILVKKKNNYFIMATCEAGLRKFKIDRIERIKLTRRDDYFEWITTLSVTRDNILKVSSARAYPEDDFPRSLEEFVKELSRVKLEISKLEETQKMLLEAMKSLDSDE